MDQQFDKIAAFNVPQSVPEQIPGSIAIASERPALASPEAQAGHEMMPIQQPVMLPQPPQFAQPVSPMATPVAMPAAGHPIQTTTANDSDDDLDAEWIEKAKAIVEQTKADPYLQSRELSKVRADYLKSRHGKEVKIAED